MVDATSLQGDQMEAYLILLQPTRESRSDTCWFAIISKGNSYEAEGISGSRIQTCRIDKLRRNVAGSLTRFLYEVGIRIVALI